MPLPMINSLHKTSLAIPPPAAHKSVTPATPGPRVVKELKGVELAKRLAAYAAVDKHLHPDHKVIGIGSGSTVPYVVERIVSQGSLNQDRVFIASGFQSKELIASNGLNGGDVDEYPTIDVTFDGADEVDPQLNCIKGGGACHLREKVLAEAANIFILVADSRKNVPCLGTNFKQGVPIEVVPFAYAKVLLNMRGPLGSPLASLRMATMKAGPVVTDNGNFVIDAPFENDIMQDPFPLTARIKMLTGVVEVGLFCHMAQAAYFGNEDGSVTVKWQDGKVETIPQGHDNDHYFSKSGDNLTLPVPGQTAPKK